MLIIVMGLMLAACGNKEKPNDPEPVESNVQTEPETDPVGDVDAESKILVVYFSWSGNLHKMAGWVADETGGDLVRVTAKDAYPDDYDETADRAKQEQDDGIRPEINVELTTEQLAQYDVVFFGFPVWWYDLPMPMWTLLENYGFSGKTIIPFFSHEGSSNGANALPTLTELAGGATVRTEDALSIRGGRVADSEGDVRDWVRDLGYGK
ncbi:MAG: NAD(P)H-dependent oxidoreductase [Lachnospiraceae bacterium]|nr:NAD(P)H-dependent oxidoreductase [Lachnospiraceae bacterium]